MLAETDGSSGALHVRYVLADGQLLSQQQGSSFSHYLTDAQGSARLLTSGTAAITDTYDYDAYGDIHAQMGTTPNRYLYTGQRHDATTGDYYLRARQYDPGNGRFLSRDMWPLDHANPVELNRYVYAAGNPVMFSDPSGYTFSGWGRITSTMSNVFRSALSHPLTSSIRDGAFGGATGYLLGVTAATLIRTGEECLDSDGCNLISTITSNFNNAYSITDQILSIVGGGLIGIATHPFSIIKRPPYQGPIPGTYENIAEEIARGVLSEWETGRGLLGMAEGFIRLSSYVTGVITMELGRDFLSGNETDRAEAVEGMIYNLAAFVGITQENKPRWVSFSIWFAKGAGPVIIDEFA